MAQILKVRPSSRVLVTTQSNSACDEIAVRLLDYVSTSKIFRFYSPALLDGGFIHPKLKKSSNLRNMENEPPTKEQLQHFRVVICTLVTSSRISQTDIGSDHFDYIFVDEICCATEPEALVPIACLGSTKGQMTANVIILGDHKQLGPVLSSEEIATKFGLDVSLMERLMRRPKYSKSPTFDARCVVQLLDNYRSHPSILQFSSDQFYGGELVAKMSTRNKRKTEAWSFLPTKNFPMVFHAVKTPSQLDGTSSYNVGELDVVKQYVKKLMATNFGDQKLTQVDIGIITPYQAQLRKLKRSIGYFCPEMEMGTAEYFQGREKRVIIISLVKSMSGVGFLDSEKVRNNFSSTESIF